MIEVPFKNERAAWRALHGGNKASSTRRERARKDFARIFTRGQKTDIRGYVQDFVRIAEASEPFPASFRDLGRIHPRALRLLAEFGSNQSAFSWERSDPYNNTRQPVPKGCFLNACIFLNGARDTGSGKTPLVYVEGIAFGPLIEPMLHAWNANGVTGRIAYDWTLYARARFTRYIGIPFTEDEYWEALRRISTVSPDALMILFSQENFPHIENYIRSILAKRKKRRIAF